MADGLLPQGDHGEEEDEADQGVAHEAEVLDEEVRGVGAGPAAKVHHRAGCGAVGRRVEGVVREQADEYKEKEAEQRDTDDLFP